MNLRKKPHRCAACLGVMQNDDRVIDDVGPIWLSIGLRSPLCHECVRLMNALYLAHLGKLDGDSQEACDLFQVLR